jgi:Protein of unknown function (DUF3152)
VSWRDRWAVPVSLLITVGTACSGAGPAAPVGPARPAASSAAPPSAGPLESSSPEGPLEPSPSPGSLVPARASPPVTVEASPPPAPGPVPAEPVTVRYRMERRTRDAVTEGFEDDVEATLSDPRGWSRAGFHLIRDPAALYVVVLAEGPEVDALCLPYDTYGKYSCQNGPVVALNADRWRTAHPKWTGDLAAFRQMLVNHEVGHLLGQHHPAVQCPGRGRRAPVMAQQTTELDGCLPNPWPLECEVARAARHDLPLAPPFER